MLSYNGRCLPVRSLLSNCVSKVSEHSKPFSLGVVCYKSHYDSLGVTPHATQADIKSAYYKLSMMYHPDKNKGSDDAPEKFRDICAAYEVLGNFRLRRLYDKGILHTAGPGFSAESYPEAEEDDATTKFYKSRMKRSTAPTPSGRTPIYNFDEWSRAHYGASFARAEAAKLKYERKHTNVHEEKHDIQNEILIFSIALVIVAFFFTSMKNSESFDIVKPETKTNEKEAPTNLLESADR